MAGIRTRSAFPDGTGADIGGLTPAPAANTSGPDAARAWLRATTTPVPPRASNTAATRVAATGAATLGSACWRLLPITPASGFLPA